MKGQFRKVFVLTAGIIVAALIAGCEEQNASDADARLEVQKHRLIAGENRQLRKELDDCGGEVETQKKLLDTCQQEKDALKVQLNEKLNVQMSEKSDVQMMDILGSVLNENAKLRQENESLRAEIEKLKKEPGKSADSEQPCRAKGPNEPAAP